MSTTPDTTFTAMRDGTREDYQLIGTRVVDLDDRVIIQDWIERNRIHE